MENTEHWNWKEQKKIKNKRLIEIFEKSSTISDTIGYGQAHN